MFFAGCFISAAPAFLCMGHQRDGCFKALLGRRIISFKGWRWIQNLIPSYSILWCFLWNATKYLRGSNRAILKLLLAQYYKDSIGFLIKRYYWFCYWDEEWKTLCNLSKKIQLVQVRAGSKSALLLGHTCSKPWLKRDVSLLFHQLSSPHTAALLQSVPSGQFLPAPYKP